MGPASCPQALAAALPACGLEMRDAGTRIFAPRLGGRRADDLATWPRPGLLQAAGTVYALIHDGEAGGLVRGCRGGRSGGRRQLGAAAGPAASGSNLDGAGSCHVRSCGFGAARGAAGQGRACSPLPRSLTCPGGQRPDPGRAAGARVHGQAPDGDLDCAQLEALALKAAGAPMTRQAVTRMRATKTARLFKRTAD